jgi:hypothetical protein
MNAVAIKRMSLSIFPLALLAGSALAGASPGAGGATAMEHASAEHAAASADEFSQLDANHDAVLSQAEMARHSTAAHMAMVDDNGDGVLGRDEFAELEGM